MVGSRFLRYQKLCERGKSQWATPHFKVEYEYTEDADLIPDFELTELDQNDQESKNVISFFFRF